METQSEIISITYCVLCAHVLPMQKNLKKSEGAYIAKVSEMIYRVNIKCVGYYLNI